MSGRGERILFPRRPTSWQVFLQSLRQFTVFKCRSACLQRTLFVRPGPTPNHRVVIHVFIRGASRSFPNDVSMNVHFRMFLGPFPRELLPRFLGRRFRSGQELIVSSVAMRRSNVSRILRLLLRQVNANNAVFKVNHKSVIGRRVREVIRLQGRELSCLKNVVVNGSLFYPSVVRPFRHRRIPRPRVQDLIHGRKATYRALIRYQILIRRRPPIHVWNHSHVFRPTGLRFQRGSRIMFNRKM